jgi:hypothetical protein
MIEPGEIYSADLDVAGRPCKMASHSLILNR